MERITLFTVLVQLDNATAKHTAERFGQALNRFDAAMHSNMTYDNGREMAQHKALSESTGIKVYFAHPYSPWERGRNENTNGPLRRVLPKGTDLSIYTQEQLDAIAFHHNAKSSICLLSCGSADLPVLAAVFVLRGMKSPLVENYASHTKFLTGS